MTRGRPPRMVVQPEILEELFGHIERGHYPERAALASGVPERTYYEWKSRGLAERTHIEGGKPARKTWAPYLDFVDRLDVALAKAETALLDDVRSGGSFSDAARWVLERRFADRWTKTARPAPVKAGSSGTVPTKPASPLDEVLAQRDKRRNVSSS